MRNLLALHTSPWIPTYSVDPRSRYSRLADLMGSKTHMKLILGRRIAYHPRRHHVLCHQHPPPPKTSLPRSRRPRHSLCVDYPCIHCARCAAESKYTRSGHGARNGRVVKSRHEYSRRSAQLLLGNFGPRLSLASQ